MQRELALGERADCEIETRAAARLRPRLSGLRRVLAAAARSAGLTALVWATAGCPGKPAAKPAPPPPPPPVGPTTPPPVVPAPPPPEAGTVKLGSVMMTGGMGMSDSACSSAKSAFIHSFEQSTAAFRRCYAAALSRKPALAGAIDVKLVLARDGSVYELEPSDVKLEDPEMVRCVLAALRALRYAPLDDGEYFSIAPVLHFTPE
jgi:hypothetical protein